MSKTGQIIGSGLVIAELIDIAARHEKSLAVKFVMWLALGVKNIFV